MLNKLVNKFLFSSIENGGMRTDADQRKQRQNFKRKNKNTVQGKTTIHYPGDRFIRWNALTDVTLPLHVEKN